VEEDLGCGGTCLVGCLVIAVISAAIYLTEFTDLAHGAKLAIAIGCLLIVGGIAGGGIYGGYYNDDGGDGGA